MSDLLQDQTEKRASIQKTATIWGVIAGAVAGLLALWILGGQGTAVRYGGAIVVALAVGFVVFRASFKSGAKAALCEKCGSAFSRSRSDQTETLASSTPKEEREEQPDKSTKVTTWIEEIYDVVDTYTCANCKDVTTNAYQSTRRRDEKSIIEPVEPPKRAEKSKKAGLAAEQSKKGEPAAAQSEKAASKGAKGRKSDGGDKSGGAGSRKK